MQKIVLDDQTQYWYFPKQADFFKVLTDKLAEGYQIQKTIGLCCCLVRLERKIWLSYSQIEGIQTNIESVLKMHFKNEKIVYPNASCTILNEISAIKRYFKQEDSTDDFEGIQSVVLLILDGMGMNVLEQTLPDDAFLKRHLKKARTAVYPSTTAAATTSIKSGCFPYQTAWLGWENYFKEVDRSIVLFTGRDYQTGEDCGFSAYQALPYTLFWADLDVNGNGIEPDFSKPDRCFSEVLEQSLAKLDPKKKNVQYVYFTEPDALLHEYGLHHPKVIEKCVELDRQVEEYAKKLPEGTLLWISADHGHTAVEPIELYHFDLLLKMLKRNPTNEGRCLFFSVIPSQQEAFCKLFNDLFGYAYTLYSKEEFLKKEFLGPLENRHPRLDDFLGDYIAVATNHYYFKYVEDKDDFTFKSHHAGITADEMLVPWIVFRK